MQAETRVLDAGGRATLAGLTFPSFRPLLSGDSPGLVALGVFSDGDPAGLALAMIRESSVAEILSLYVLPSFRQKGHEDQLLAALESEVRALGASSIEFCYSTPVDRADSLHDLLVAHGYPAPVPRMLICKAGKKILTAPWLHKGLTSAEFTIVSWADFSLHDSQVLENLRSEIPPTLFPLWWQAEPFPIELSTSLLLRYRGDLAGWLITHRTAPDTLRYSCLYVTGNLQRMARAVTLLSAGIERQLELMGPSSYGIWATPYKYPGMIAFIRRRMAPYLESLRESRLSKKILDGAGFRESECSSI